MATYKIKATYEYEGEIEANSPEEAEKKFLADLNDYYSSTEEYECVEHCDECGDSVEDCELLGCETDDEEEEVA